MDRDGQQAEQIGQAFADLAAEPDSKVLAAAIVEKALALTGSDAGVLYLQPASGVLCCEAIMIDSQGLSLADENLTQTLPLVHIPDESDGTGSCLLRSYLQKRTLLVENRAAGQGEFEELKQFEQVFAYSVEHLLSVPLCDPQGQVNGVLQLMNPGTGSFSDRDRLLAEQLASWSGNLLYKNQQIEAQKALFESMIQMIAGAVDEKFYLGADHCRRVPLLVMMLARAVNRSDRPPFADQVLDEQELYELEVAAWLHDCGKLVTPINLVDKSSKLETVFDRIDLIQTRFEILRRDQEILRLRKGGRGEEVPLPETGPYHPQRMLEDMHFLSTCNHGKKNMTDEDQRRLQVIFDSYHWIDRQMEEQSVLTQDELANLSIASGTINESERVKINNHALSSVGMLDLLPFPDELSRVPEIVSGYHETRTGQTLLQTRILAVADLYVSVTAENRSYRKTNSLDDALQILYAMADEDQLDRDLLDLFVAEHLPQQYAAEFLSHDQPN